MVDKVTVPDPAAFGLLGLALVTLVAGAYQLGFITNVSLVIPWALIMGGVAQVMTGAKEFSRNNIFGATAFSAYGMFWIAVAATWAIEIWGEVAVDTMAIGWASVGWLIFSLYMTYGSAAINKLLFAIFVLIDFVFISLIVHFFAGVSVMLPGIANLSLSLASFYGSASVLLNNFLGKTVLPVGSRILK